MMGKKDRMLIRAFLVSASCLAVSVVATAQGGVRVIVSPDVEITDITQAEVARIYLGKKTFWDSGARISPSLLDENSSVTESFLEENLKKTVRQFRAYWKRHLFSGQGTAPRTFSSSKQVADFVVANPGAIGVVDAAYADDRVKFLSINP